MLTVETGVDEEFCAGILVVDCCDGLGLAGREGNVRWSCVMITLDLLGAF